MVVRHAGICRQKGSGKMDRAEDNHEATGHFSRDRRLQVRETSQ
jgi:hypothetical protein